MDTVASRSAVHFIPYADPRETADYFSARLAYETDCADVWTAIEGGEADFVMADCRPTGNYTKLHIPGAVSLPWRDITVEKVSDLPDLPIVTYCWGPSCNAATKGALRLAQLGRQVKEMIGGLEYWIREGHPTEGRRPTKTGKGKPSDWGLVI
jgi:rhodanese-related sulfurtransferase